MGTFSTSERVAEARETGWGKRERSETADLGQAAVSGRSKRIT
jgi:hypothetical protein